MALALFGLSACQGWGDREVPDQRDCDERTVYYRDSDGDTFGTDDHMMLACIGASGWSKKGGDCDDTDATVTTECHQFDTGEPVDTGEPGDTGTQDTGASEEAAGAAQ
jgi:hypothetical protein